MVQMFSGYFQFTSIFFMMTEITTSEKKCNSKDAIANILVSFVNERSKKYNIVEQ